MITEQLSAGDDYSKIKRVISIIITDYALIPENNIYHNCYTLYDPATHSEFTDLIEVNTLELVKLPETEDGTELWAWMKFLSARNKEDLNMLAKKNPQVGKAVVRLMELSNDERTRLLYESQQKMEWDNLARERAARSEGLSEGRKEGLSEGLNKGRKEGLSEGRKEIARNLLAEGLSVEIIQKTTGLGAETIQSLKE
jgi:predicted transposase/invertase (TIGR01784 family)